MMMHNDAESYVLYISKLLSVYYKERCEYVNEGMISDAAHG